MTDCMFHGQGPPGACRDCEREDKRKVKRGTIEPDFEYGKSVMMGPDFHPDPLVRSPRKR